MDVSDSFFFSAEIARIAVDRFRRLKQAASLRCDTLVLQEVNKTLVSEFLWPLKA
jgi:hypothetical protein